MTRATQKEGTSLHESPEKLRFLMDMHDLVDACLVDDAKIKGIFLTVDLDSNELVVYKLNASVAEATAILRVATDAQEHLVYTQLHNKELIN